jgi:hypothetical protein
LGPLLLREEGFFAGVFAGVINGIFLGWIIGWIIDQLNQRSLQNNAVKDVNNQPERSLNYGGELGNQVSRKSIPNNHLKSREVLNNYPEMNMQNKSLQNEEVRDSLILLLLKANEQAFTLLQKREKLPNNGIAEAFIYNVFLSKIFLKRINPELFNEIRSDYDLSMVESLKAFGLESRLPNLIDFLNKRMSFFREELEAFQANTNHLPSRLYYVFYENPLTDNPVPTMNLVNLMPFSLSLLAMTEHMKETVEIIDSQYSQIE